MTAPKMSWDINVNTLLSVGSFVILMGTGAMAYASFEAQSKSWQAEATRRFENLERQTQANSVAIQQGQVDQGRAQQDAAYVKEALGLLRADLHEQTALIQKLLQSRVQP
jgi:hypothetical protein